MKVATCMQQGSAQSWFKRTNNLLTSSLCSTQTAKVERAPVKFIPDTKIQGYF
jgi:hypothetical protein